MASLKEQVQSGLHEAIRARDETRKGALRLLTAAIKNTEIETGAPLDDAATLTVIQKQAKQRRESIAEYGEAGRTDLVAREQAELEILEAYLPEQASDGDIEAAAREIIASTGASGPRDIGKVMPPLMERFAGRADGRRASEIVRKLL